MKPFPKQENSLSLWYHVDTHGAKLWSVNFSKTFVCDTISVKQACMTPPYLGDD